MVYAFITLLVASGTAIALLHRRHQGKILALTKELQVSKDKLEDALRLDSRRRG